MKRNIEPSNPHPPGTLAAASYDLNAAVGRLGAELRRFARGVLHGDDAARCALAYGVAVGLGFVSLALFITALQH